MKNAKLENKVTKRDSIIWIIMGVILLLAIYANNYFSHQAIAIRLIGWIIDILDARAAVLGICTSFTC
jgi:hypothetical protein